LLAARTPSAPPSLCAQLCDVPNNVKPAIITVLRTALIAQII
jgi:hypothetical protein